KLNYLHAREIAAEVISSYSQEEVDGVFLIYNSFKSVLSQKVLVEQLLPLADFQPAEGSTDNSSGVDYIYEQPPQEIYASLLPKYVEVQIFGALLESAASEHAARMTAMEAATSNAGDMIDSLTLSLNRIRQAAITKELIEVVSGAASL
ncbi:MAG: F0F1 ATP synthase subunit gamma, partial [Acidobacteriota bacterium]